ncbi:MAG: YqeG family HAD IIIA-type phosphatase [Fimbriimonadales bacterium]|jgi:HAD superfamily phosphatase (TIGR01668 family)|nr:YqeG family HAD IIIA-type phosphatase [Fimbriimonadales bacterium]GIV14342.1 MAG: haloacid dehalogenase [Fimbriimonadales bacterium]
MRFDREQVPKWLRRWCPDEHVAHVSEITPERLQALGIRALLLDLDNTITPWRSRQVPETVRQWIQQMKEAGIRLCFVSNTRNLGRLRWLSETLGIPYARGPMKPRRAMLQRAIEMLQVKPDETAIVGDQLFTDVWGGNRLGIYTIWVRPLAPREFVGTKISRRVERWLLGKIKPYARPEEHAD